MNENVVNGPSYYVSIPASVRYDKELVPLARLLYGEIAAICKEEEYCWAGNSYFANLYGTSERNVRRWIENLKSCDYIQVEFEEGYRRIEILNISMEDV